MRRARRQSGRTFLELVVTALLLALLAIGIMRVGPALHGGTRKLEARARSVSELRMASEYLLQDLGGAVEVTETVDGDLHLVRLQALAERLGAWVGGLDAGVLYELDGDALVRSDLALGSVVVVARELDAFVVSEDTGVDTTVTLASGEGLAERSLQLVWSW